MPPQNKNPVCHVVSWYLPRRVYSAFCAVVPNGWTRKVLDCMSQYEAFDDDLEEAVYKGLLQLRVKRGWVMPKTQPVDSFIAERLCGQDWPVRLPDLQRSHAAKNRQIPTVDDGFASEDTWSPCEGH